MPNKKMLSIEEISSFLNVSKRTAYNLLKNEGLPAVKIGNQWRITQAALEDWVDQLGRARLSGKSLKDNEAGGPI